MVEKKTKVAEEAIVEVVAPAEPVSMSPEDACRHLGIGMVTLVAIAARGDVAVERDENDEIVSVRIV